MPRGYVSLLGCNYFHCHTVTCNRLHSKNSKYTIYNIDIRVDVLCMRLCKQIINKMINETENVNNHRELKDL